MYGKKSVAFLLAAAILGNGLRAEAQSCNPDYSQKDKISKQQVDAWNQELSSNGILSAALLDRDVSVTATIGRYGDENRISITLVKQEENLARAAFESQYHAAKGDRFSFGFADGAPVSFIATDVSNEAKASAMSGRLSMTVALFAHPSDEEMAALRAALTSRRVDAVRLALSTGQVDKTVSDKNAQKLSQKINCFYTFAEARGANFSANKIASGQSLEGSGGGTENAAVAGRYQHMSKGGNTIQLRGDGSYVLLQDGHALSGTYRLQSDTVALTSLQFPKQHPKAIVSSNRLKFLSDGSTYEKIEEVQKSVNLVSKEEPQRSGVLTLEQVIQMVQAKLADDIIVSTIQKAAVKFDVTPEALVKLKTSGASDAVIRALARP